MIDTQQTLTTVACEKNHKPVPMTPPIHPVAAETSLPEELVFPFALVAEQLLIVEEQIQAQAHAFDPGVAGYVEYVCGTSGKRIRPALAFLAGGACGSVNAEVVKLGVILEMIHLASLVHDDIMDGATIRRKAPTAAVKWGNEIYIPSGEIRPRKGRPDFPGPEEGLPRRKGIGPERRKKEGIHLGHADHPVRP